MNLAICSVGELFGGVERHILGMCTWLQRQGHQPLLVLFHDRELAKQAREIGVEPVILATRGSFDLGAVRRLGALLAGHEIDVVHAHGYRAVVNCALARRYHRFGMVRTVHGLVESGAAFSLPYIKTRLFLTLEKWAGRMAKAKVVYVTEDLRHKRTGSDNDQTSLTIHNGIDSLDSSGFDRPSDIEPGKIHLAAVGRVSRVKGLEFALEALARLDVDVDTVLNIIGTGPVEGELKAHTKRLGLDGRVRFLGFRKNIFNYLAHVDVLLMPSHHEGLPYTLLEAMSLQVPVIASNVGGIPEVLVDGESGILVQVGDAAGLADSISKLVTDPDTRRRLGLAGKKLQAEKFDLDTMGSAYYQEYRQLIEKA